MISKNEILKEKWISDAAYYKSLERDVKVERESQDWLDAEQEFERLMGSRVKSGLVRCNYIVGNDCHFGCISPIEKQSNDTSVTP